MKIKWWHIYIISKLDDLRTLLELTMFFLAFPILGYVLIVSHSATVSIILLVCVVILWFIRLILPTTNNAVVIYLLPKIANNEHIPKMPGKIVEFLNRKFDEWLEMEENT